jgi:REP element-mobilizing transposase RayT
MPRIEYAGAVYHIMNRGDHREPIFLDDIDRLMFLRTLGEACEKTGWQIHALVLMDNHFHTVTETPQPNLVVGMHWLLGTYTSRFNRRHELTGHLFGGRYKAIPIDTRTPGYLLAAGEYVHLNPDRPGLVPPEQPLRSYRWSSFPLYLDPRKRPPWLRVDRLLGEYGVQADNPAGRRRFLAATEARRQSRRGVGKQRDLFWRKWRLGADDFAEFLASKLARGGEPDESPPAREELDAVRAERLVREALKAEGWSEQDLHGAPKGHPVKVRIAAQLRRETPMKHKWIVTRLNIGSAEYLRLLLWRHAKSR